jgi:hypothetical protein
LLTRMTGNSLHMQLRQGFVGFSMCNIIQVMSCNGVNLKLTFCLQGCRSYGGSQLWGRFDLEFRLQRKVDGLSEQGPQRSVLLQHDQLGHYLHKYCNSFDIFKKNNFSSFLTITSLKKRKDKRY